jgi:hypothetical protein
MKLTVVLTVAAVALSAPLRAQERKPVPKDSVRVFLPGCSKGQIFTVGPRTEDAPGRFDIPAGMHLRMNGPKAMMNEIHAHEGAMVEVTGLMKKGQHGPDGVSIGGGVRISPGPTGGGGMGRDPYVSQIMIDVEGWRPVPGNCPAR